MLARIMSRDYILIIPDVRALVPVTSNTFSAQARSAAELRLNYLLARAATLVIQFINVSLISVCNEIWAQVLPFLAQIEISTSIRRRECIMAAVCNNEEPT